MMLFWFKVKSMLNAKLYAFVVFFRNCLIINKVEIDNRQIHGNCSMCLTHNIYCTYINHKLLRI